MLSNKKDNFLNLWCLWKSLLSDSSSVDYEKTPFPKYNEKVDSIINPKEKCPNCDSYSFLEWYWCSNCWYMILHYDEELFFDNFYENKSNISMLNFSFDLDFFKSTKIWYNKKDKKVELIYFNDKNWDDFVIIIDSYFLNEQKNYSINFCEQEAEEREYCYKKVSIKDISISSIKSISWDIINNKKLFKKINQFVKELLIKYHSYNID